VHYYDDRNKYDEANGWPTFDPDNLAQATVPLGTVLADPDTVHVLRGGTEPVFVRRGAPSGIAVSFAPSHVREPVRGGSQYFGAAGGRVDEAREPDETELVYTHLYAKGEPRRRDGRARRLGALATPKPTYIGNVVPLHGASN
jgi:hypothetical protein